MIQGDPTRVTLQQLRAADWEATEREVVEKLRILRAICHSEYEGDHGDRIANELILPCLSHLGRFCTAVQVKDPNKIG